jgi:hypothetical protein
VSCGDSTITLGHLVLDELEVVRLPRISLNQYLHVVMLQVACSEMKLYARYGQSCRHDSLT